jgi:hypothetical protein
MAENGIVDEIITDVLTKEVGFFAQINFQLIFLKEVIRLKQQTDPMYYNVDVVNDTLMFRINRRKRRTRSRSKSKSGHRKPYVINYELNHLITELTKMRHKKLVLIPFLFIFEGEQVGHANMLVVVRHGDYIIVEHFEPHGVRYFGPIGIVSEGLRDQCLSDIYRTIRRIFREEYSHSKVLYIPPSEYQSAMGSLGIQQAITLERQTVGYPVVWSNTCFPISVWYAITRSSELFLYEGFDISQVQSALETFYTSMIIGTQKILTDPVNPVTITDYIINLIKTQLVLLGTNKDIGIYTHNGVTSFLYKYHTKGLELSSRQLRPQQYAQRAAYRILPGSNIEIYDATDEHVRSIPGIITQIDAIMANYFKVTSIPNPAFMWRIITQPGASGVQIVKAFFQYIETADSIHIYSLCAPVLVPEVERRGSLVAALLNGFRPDKVQYLEVDRYNYYFEKALLGYHRAGFRVYQVNDSLNHIQMIRPIGVTPILDSFTINGSMLKNKYTMVYNVHPTRFGRSLDDLLQDLTKYDGISVQIHPSWKRMYDNTMDAKPIMQKIFARFKFIPELVDSSILNIYLKHGNVYIELQKHLDRLWDKLNEEDKNTLMLTPMLISTPDGVYYT